MQMVTRFPGGARVDTAFDDYVVRTDQPVKAGGQGAFPSPFDTFLASISACAGHYVLAFCRARGLPTRDLRIVQTTERNPESHLVTRIHLAIHVPADFPERYRGALIRAADQCTVKRHFAAPPEIVVTTLAGAPTEAEEPRQKFGT